MIYFGNIPYLDQHIKLLSSLTGKNIFVVGGSVRDILMGITSNPIDIDATCFADPQDIFHSLQDHATQAIGIFRTEKFGTSRIIISSESPLYNLQGDEIPMNSALQYTYEITPFREEGGYTDRRHPTDIVWTNSLISDAGRRDFTVNALYYTSIGIDYTNSAPIGAALHVDTDQLLDQLEKQGRSYIHGVQLLIIQNPIFIDMIVIDGVVDEKLLSQFCFDNGIPYDTSAGIRIILDPKQGIQDIITQKLRTVGDPDRRFNEDALRILRALRFVNIRNQKLPGMSFDFHKDTWNSLKKQYHLIQYIAKERIHDELVKVFSANNPFGYIALLDEANLLQYIFPALYRCKYNDQPIRYHPFDTYTHTLLTLWHLEKINTHYLVKLGMLYHDVGKPDQYYYYAQCKTKEELEGVHASWANHIVCGPEYVQRDFALLGFSQKEIDEITWYVAMHMRPGQILEAREDNQLKKVRALYSEYGFDQMYNLFDICKSDRLGQYNPLQGGEIDAVDILYNHLEYLRDNEGQFTKKDLAINGNDIMHTFTLQPGSVIGELLEKAFQRVLHEKESRNNSQTILTYLKGIIAHGN